jgi:Lrp/AsnC family transcriptional regulator, leucine-responsive regulatory protein
MELDESDIKILKALQGDARLSMRDLAALAGVSTPTASAKVKAFEAKGLVRGYGAVVSPEALGQSVLVLDVRVRPSDAPGVGAKLAELSEARAIYAMGAGRLLVFATLIDPALVPEFIAKISAVPEIASMEAQPIVKTMKELPQAVIDRGAMIAVKCEFCGRRTKDQVLRLKDGELTHFVCCESCKKGLSERLDRLKKLAGKGKVRSQLTMASL